MIYVIETKSPKPGVMARLQRMLSLFTPSSPRGIFFLNDHAEPETFTVCISP